MEWRHRKNMGGPMGVVSAGDGGKGRGEIGVILFVSRNSNYKSVKWPSKLSIDIPRGDKRQRDTQIDHAPLLQHRAGQFHNVDGSDL